MKQKTIDGTGIIVGMRIMMVTLIQELHLGLVPKIPNGQEIIRLNTGKKIGNLLYFSILIKSLRLVLTEYILILLMPMNIGDLEEKAD